MERAGFRDRTDAGRALARKLMDYSGRDDMVVLGLPRGGIPVAFEIAKSLRAPLDVFLTGKLGYPGEPELALGAVTSQGKIFFNLDLLGVSGLSEEEADLLAQRKIQELQRKETRYRRSRDPVPIEGKTVLLVDDGSATGATMRVALEALKQSGPGYIIAAVPIASSDALRGIREAADEAVCLGTPEPFHSVGNWYRNFTQVTEEEVTRCLDNSVEWLPREGPQGEVPSVMDSAEAVTVRIRVGDAELAADLTLPHDPVGVVLFAHGSGSGRHSPRNRQVARALHQGGLATLLLDLLTRREEDVDQNTAEFRFDIGLLAERLLGATRWALEDFRLSHLKIGYFGASTGAAAALIAAARLPNTIGAVVSRGGRPDLAGASLGGVAAPTLLIVGGEDGTVLDLNRQALNAMRDGNKLQIVPGATHLFEEPGALEEVSRLARDWFARHLAQVASPVE